MKIESIKPHWNRYSLLDLANKTLFIRDTLPYSETLDFRKKANYFHLDRNYRKGVLTPENSFKLFWDIIIILMIIGEALILPFLIILPMSQTQSIREIDSWSQLFFGLDILINLNTGFYEKGKLNTQRKRIFFHHLKGSLLLDLITICPNFLFSDSFVLYEFFFVFKLYRVYKLFRYLEIIELVINSLLFLKLFYYFKKFLKVLILLHWMTCIWFWISLYDESHVFNTWLISDINHQYYDVFIRCFYYVVTTTTTLGYGDYYPVSTNENIVALIILFLGVIIFSFNITSLIDKVIGFRKKKIEYQEKLIKLNVYMKKKNLPDFLKFKLRRHLEYNFQRNNQNLIKESDILSFFSDQLREEIFGYTSAGKMIQKCKIFFQIYQTKILKKLSKYMINKFYGPNDLITEEGAIFCEIYFLTYGSVEVTHSKTQTVFKILKRNNFFGEVGFFTKRPRTATIRCLEIVESFCLKREDFDIVLIKFPAAVEVTKQLESLCENDDYSVLGIKCYLCRKPGHVAAKCANVALNIEKQEIKKKWLESKKSTKVINPKSYYHPNTHRHEKSPKNYKLPKPFSDQVFKSETQLKEYNTLIDKISSQRLETIREEENEFCKIETENYHQINRILSSSEREEDENSIFLESEPLNPKDCRLDVTEIKGNKSWDENIRISDL